MNYKEILALSDFFYKITGRKAEITDLIKSNGLWYTEQEIVYNHNLTLEQIEVLVKETFPYCNIFVEDNTIVIEDDFEPSENQKNDDDCCDVARNNGEIVVEDFPMLEVSNVYCHRHKYAIVELKFKHDNL